MSFAITSVALSGTGLGMGVVGSLYGAQSNKNNLTHQAAMDDINARLSERGAQATLLAGERQQQGVRLNTAKIKSSQRVAMAANGIALDSGTAINNLTSTDVMGEMDAINVQTNALSAAWGYRTQTVNLQNAGNAKRTAANNINPAMDAFTTAISGAGKVAPSWYQMKKAGW
jgi:hypothetical protein